MKKLLIILLAFTFVLSLSACSGSMGDVNDKAPVNEATDDKSKDAKNEKDNVNNTKITIEEKVIYDENDIKVTVKGLNIEASFGPEIELLIENNSNKNITVQARYSSINGMMIDNMFSSDVATGKKSNSTIGFFTADLELAGITTIKEIEFSLNVIDSDTWDSIVESDMITLTTSADASYKQTYDDTGYVAYDSDGIKVVVKKLNSSESFWGSDVYLYMENNTKNNITVQSSDVSINGFMVDPIFSTDIIAGKKAIDTMTFMESDLTDNGVTDITELEFKLHIFDLESWDTIMDSDTIKVSFQ